MTNVQVHSTPFLIAERRAAHKARNRLHSIILITGMGIIMTVCAWLIWGWVGVIFSLAITGLLSVFTPRIPPELVMRMYRAQPIDIKHGNQLIRVLDILADRAELDERPRLFVIPSSTLNAFATGTPDRAFIAVTEGLLRRLNLREIAGVLAHEVSHIRNNDLWVMGLADVMSRFTQVMAYVGMFLLFMNIPLMILGEEVIPWSVGLVLYLAPTVGSLLQLALSRTREYDADLEGSQLTGDPIGLASALKKLEQNSGHIWEDMIYPGRKIPQPSLLRSHPPTRERVRRLQQLKPTMPAIAIPEEPMITLAGYGPATLYPRYHWPWPGIWY